ncbi:MAG: DUF1343 domain-containing protein [Paludibacteraceae bacterium]|nr:DUF1343 domain-containing protein [Paludibacteraceae bacterium]
MRRASVIVLALVLLAGTGCCKHHEQAVQVGAERTELYLDSLKGKRVAMLGNHTSLVKSASVSYSSVGKAATSPTLGEELASYTHTLDMLLGQGVNMVAVFSPEHGFRGTASAGEHVSSSVDEKTGLPILSLYSGGSARPSDEDMERFDVLLIDIQDVGLRFYTYYITMVRLMNACADFGKQVIVLDRPNPNGYYVDGPILDMQHKSGVGYLPIPVVHGMTLGELALMVNGEGWLPDGKQCPLKVVPCANYTHQTKYQLLVPPSPNLRNQLAIYLYPSICLFEGTPVSLGRGTDKPFLCYGHPGFEHSSKVLYSAEPHTIGKAVQEFESSLFGKASYDRQSRAKVQMFTFTPRECEAAKNPPQMDKLCYGVDLSGMSEEEAMQKHFDLEYVIDAYNRLQIGEAFFTKFFVKLTGQDYIQQMIMEGKSAEEIAEMWKDDVAQFKAQRKPYLLYEE